MDRMKLRYVDTPKVKPKTLEELRGEIEHYKSLYARTKQDGILELINTLEIEFLNLEIKLRPDEWKKYNSTLLGITLNVNYTKEEIHGSDGTFYSFEEFSKIPSELTEDQFKLIHQVKLLGCKKSGLFEELPL